MENRINIAELLKDCPKGMELDSTNYSGVITFEEITDSHVYPIKIRVKYGDECLEHILTKYGQACKSSYHKCVIFPKGKTTWEGFVPPCRFKDGDIVTWEYRGLLVACIYKERKNTASFNHHIALYDSGLGIMVNGEITLTDDELRFATEEEKQNLFQAINDSGYKWNTEAKTLEKLIKPTFKAGNKIKHKENAEWVCTIRRVEDRYYVDGHPTCFTILFSEQDKYELVPNKFDINTLKTFDQVLVRLTNNCVWMPKLFSYYATGPNVKYYPFVTIDNIGYPQCIPYNGNEHLCRTTNNCDEFYRVWEE